MAGNCWGRNPLFFNNLIEERRFLPILKNGGLRAVDIMKSERLKKFENELQDLEQWLKLGLVPKKDIQKHREEIVVLTDKIEEEKVRLRYLKENGEVEEYTPPKRGAQARGAYQEPHSLPDMDINEEGLTDAGLEMETEAYELKPPLAKKLKRRRGKNDGRRRRRRSFQRS